MTWKFAERMGIWGGGTNFSGELILYYRASHWKNVTLAENRKFFALHLLTDVIRKREISIWNTNPLLRMPLMRSCPNMFSSYFKVFTFQQQLKIWCHCPRLRRTSQNFSLGWSVSYQIKNRKYTTTPGKYLLTKNWCYEKENLNSSSSYLTREVNLALSSLVCASQAVVFEILLLTFVKKISPRRCFTAERIGC